MAIDALAVWPSSSAGLGEPVARSDPGCLPRRTPAAPRPSWPPGHKGSAQSWEAHWRHHLIASQWACVAPAVLACAAMARASAPPQRRDPPDRRGGARTMAAPDVGPAYRRMCRPPLRGLCRSGRGRPAGGHGGDLARAGSPRGLARLTSHHRTHSGQVERTTRARRANSQPRKRFRGMRCPATA